ncbi:MAG: MFS transporter [Nanoarchaeota archaeon]|nr:MFS transporter [Nanoarchaeota archaeon]
MIRWQDVHLFRFNFNKELSSFFISYAVRNFAYALVGIFIPAFFLSSGYSLKAIAFYYLMNAFFMGIGCILTCSLLTKIGVKHGILISAPVTITHFLMLYSLDTYHWPLTLLALVGASASAFYWPAFHIEFVKSSDHDHRSEEFSAMNVCSYVVMIFAPLAGGFLATYFGFHILFIIVSVILCISSIPLFFTEERYEPFDFSIKNMFSKENFKDVSVFFSNGVINFTGGVLWPLFIFIALGTFLALGILSTVLMCIVTVSNYLLGRVADRLNKHALLKIGAVLGAALWFVKPFASVFRHFVVINSVEGLTSSFVDIPFFGIFYNRAQRKIDTMEYIIFRELALNAFGVVFAALVFLLVGSFKLSFILAGIANLGYMFF